MESASALAECSTDRPDARPALALDEDECQVCIREWPRLRFARGSSDTCHVRGFSPQINIILTLLAAFGLFPLLSQPWFAAAVDSNDGFQGSVELMGEAIGRWFTAQGTTATGSEALTNGKTALILVVGATLLLAVALLLPPLRDSARGLVRTIPLAAPLMVLVSIISEAAASSVEPRWGAFATLALMTFMASAAFNAGEMRVRKTPVGPYRPPVPPTYR